MDKTVVEPALRDLIAEAINALEQGYSPVGLTRKLREAIGAPTVPASDGSKPLWNDDYPKPAGDGGFTPWPRIEGHADHVPCCGQTS